MNNVFLTGRITKEPELRQTQNGNSTVSFSLAVDKIVNGEKQADFINCVAWNQQADFISRFVKKGYMLAVSGRISTRNYQAQDGTTRYVTEVITDRVENMTPREQEPQPQVQPQYQQPTQPQQYRNPQYGQPQPQPQYQGRAQTYNPNSPSAQQPYWNQGQPVELTDDDMPF